MKIKGVAGSGKSTTVYSILQVLNNKETNIKARTKLLIDECKTKIDAARKAYDKADSSVKSEVDKAEFAAPGGSFKDNEYKYDKNFYCCCNLYCHDSFDCRIDFAHHAFQRKAEPHSANAVCGSV